MPKYRRFDEGGPTYGEDERPAATGMGDIASMESESPKTFKQAFSEARAAGDKTFTFGGKKYTTDVAGGSSKPAPKAAPAPAPAPKAAPKAKSPAPDTAPKAAPKSDAGDEYSGLARLKQRFGTQEQRESVEKDIKASDVAAAKKAGEARRARDRETFFDPLKRIAARIGSAETRAKYKEEGFAKGGSVGSASRRADGCAQRGKTKGRIV